jgi:hypothetical protein
MTGAGVPQLLPDGTVATGDARYDALPRAIKDSHPYDGWAWLGANQQDRIEQTDTEPEQCE